MILIPKTKNTINSKAKIKYPIVPPFGVLV
jgi:hypothetical protein